MTVVRLDSITHGNATTRGLVVITGSHGGLGSGNFAITLGVGAIVFNDAGGGLDGAGYGALKLLDRSGIPAATVDAFSARIGDADDMVARGRLSYVNNSAKAQGLCAGDPCTDILAKMSPTLTKCRITNPEPFLRSDISEAICLLDSASDVEDTDNGKVVVTGSHGGLVGGTIGGAGNRSLAAAVFNDAGMGIEEAGIARLSRLHFPAFTVAAISARIGDARSTWATGRVSAFNALAGHAGVAVGQTTAEAVHGIVKGKVRACA